MENELTGHIDRITLVSLNLDWGFMANDFGIPEIRPENPYGETEQHLTITHDGNVKFQTFYLDGGRDVVEPIRQISYQLNDAQKSLLFHALHMIFDSGFPHYQYLDGPTWHLAINNDLGQVYQYEGMMVPDEWLMGLNEVLTMCLDQIDALWGFEIENGRGKTLAS